jgi:hypothetical protein
MLEKRDRSWVADWAKTGSSPGFGVPSENERRPIDNLGARCWTCQHLFLTAITVASEGTVRVFKLQWPQTACYESRPTYLARAGRFGGRRRFSLPIKVFKGHKASYSGHLFLLVLSAPALKLSNHCGASSSPLSFAFWGEGSTSQAREGRRGSWAGILDEGL